MTHSQRGIEIFKALQAAHEATSQEVLNYATKFIEDESRKLGYIQVLLELINQYDVPVNLTLAALAQLKVFLSKAWSRDFSLIPIPDEDREFLCKAILPTTIALCDSHKYSQFLTVIIRTIGKDLCSEMLVSQQGGQTEIEYKMERGEDLKACFMVMLGVAQAYSFATDTDRRVYFELVQRTFIPVHAILIRHAAAIEELKHALT
jgi:hypothetical protein